MLKSSSYLNKVRLWSKSRLAFVLAAFVSFSLSGQVANYVSNGGFESYVDCGNPFFIYKAKYWSDIDSAANAALYINSCAGTVPYNGFGFQYPRTGSAYLIADFLCYNCNPNLRRSYLKNRLKSHLQAGKKYCVKFHVNVGNWSTYGMDAFGAYFGDSSVDTIQKGHIPLTYLTPQVQNPNFNYITDTLGWAVVSGTFLANGIEKYIIIGNFKSDAATNTVVIQTTYPNNQGCTVSVDDVSCIPMDLPAFAGKDTTCIPGTTVYLGRARDIGIDEACTWYQLPNNTTPIATGVAGLTISPVVTSTYMVKQDICGVIKYDTVVVYKDGLGLAKQEMSYGLKIFPVPVHDEITLSIEDDDRFKAYARAKIFNHLGQLIREEEIHFTNKRCKIKTADLVTGVYLLSLETEEKRNIVAKFIIQ